MFENQFIYMYFFWLKVKAWVLIRLAILIEHEYEGGAHLRGPLIVKWWPDVEYEKRRIRVREKLL